MSIILKYGLGSENKWTLGKMSLKRFPGGKAHAAQRGWLQHKDVTFRQSCIHQGCQVAVLNYALTSGLAVESGCRTTQQKWKEEGLNLLQTNLQIQTLKYFKQ